jgi:hypothetical protein
VEGPLHALHNPRLRVHPVRVEFPSVVLLGGPHEIHVRMLLVQPHRLLIVLVRPELLHPLQIPDPLRRLLLLFP